MQDTVKKFYRDKNIFITGHTGFKGSWLSIWLNKIGANVIGYSDSIKTQEDNFVLCKLTSKLTDLRGDINDKGLYDVISKYNPEIVFHLAAQSTVLYSYKNPIETYMCNVIGTLNLLECCKKCKSIKCIVIITTDKCYLNKEWCFGYREDDTLGGHDPYSSSKACAEILVDSYRKCFINNREIGVATARAGNVIGGGDWTNDRIVVDSIKSLLDNETIKVRHPNFIRPWQHVLDPLYGYLLFGMNLYNNPQLYSEPLNFGPKSEEVTDVKTIVKKIIYYYGKGSWKAIESTTPYEANTLCLDISKAKHKLKWSPLINLDKAIEMTVYWYKNYKLLDVYNMCLEQIEYYENLEK